MNINLHTKNQRGNGFSVIELMISLAIFLLIVFLVSLLGRNTWLYNSFIGDTLTGVEGARKVLAPIAAEIRTASTSDTGAYVIANASASSFTFYSDIDDDGLREKVRYFLSGNLFQKGVIKPTGSPLVYNQANEKITTLVGDVVNSSIFDYYDENYDGTTAPLSSPLNVPAIRLVKITLTIDKDPNRPPSPITFTTQVSIRNLKDNL